MNKPFLLIVEPHRDTRELLRLLLGCNDFDAITEADGLSGVNAFSKHRPDLVLVAADLPDLTAVEFIERVKSDEAKSAGLPIVVMVDGRDNPAGVLRAGATAVVHRPEGFDDLIPLLKKVLAK